MLYIFDKVAALMFNFKQYSIALRHFPSIYHTYSIYLASYNLNHLYSIKIVIYFLIIVLLVGLNVNGIKFRNA